MASPSVGPSREFYVRQAVLDASLSYDPEAAKVIGHRAVLQTMIAGDYVREGFCDQVRYEYRALRAKHGGVG